MGFLFPKRMFLTFNIALARVASFSGMFAGFEFGKRRLFSLQRFSFYFPALLFSTIIFKQNQE